MAELSFKDLAFRQEKGRVRVNFLGNYYFYIEDMELSQISEFSVGKNTIEFKNVLEKTARRKFMGIIEKGFLNLMNMITGKKTIYIHKNSGIPLIGNGGFGLIDRNTSTIEVKPNTGCNLDCIYCSIDLKHPKRVNDIVIEKDYIVEEFKKLAEFKEYGKLEAHIGPNGEPTLYRDLIELVHDLAKIKQVKKVSMDTNGVLLNEKVIDELIAAGMNQINLSLNSINPELAKSMANVNYNVEHVKKMAKYIAGKGILLIIAPVWVPGINDNEIEGLIEFAKSLGTKLFIQNFLEYKLGKKPVKAISFEEFEKRLLALQKKHNYNLIMYNDEELKIAKTKELPCPFKRGEIVKAEVMSDGRFKGEKLCAAKDRVISVPNCPDKEEVKVKIKTTYNNIILATII